MEQQVGILKYLSEGTSFRCLFKHRFTDFIVQEIDLNGTVAEISDHTLWSEFQKKEHQIKENTKIHAFDNFQLSEEFIQQSQEYFGQEVTEQFKQLAQKIQTTGKCIQFETKVPLPDSKEERIKVHQLIRMNLPFLESFTKNQHNQKPKKDIKNEKAQEKIGQIQEDHILIKTSVINYKKYISNQFSKQTYGDSKKFVKFLLMKRNFDSINAGMFISKLLGLSNKHFSIAGTKDKRGVTTQWATLQGMEICQLQEIQERKIWNQNILMSDFKYEDSGIKLGDLQGNKFTIILRIVDKYQQDLQEKLLKNIEDLKNDGFINYFGLQRFGTKSQIKTHQIGKEIIKKNWKEVIRMILLSSQENSIELVNNLFDKDDFVNLLNQFSPRLRIERQLIDSLIKLGSHNYFTALQQLPRHARELYLHAYQSYLWNKMASLRLELYGNKIVEGDIVNDNLIEETANEDDDDQNIIEENEKVEQQIIQTNIHSCTLITNQNINQFTINNVVIPIYGTKIDIPEQSIVYKLLQQIFIEEGISNQAFEEASNKFFIDGNYRYLIQNPTEINYQIFNYENKDQDVVNSYGELQINQGNYWGLLLSLKLKKSSYATMLIREITKNSSDLQHQYQINEQYN